MSRGFGVLPENSCVGRSGDGFGFAPSLCCRIGLETFFPVRIFLVGTPRLLGEPFPGEALVAERREAILNELAALRALLLGHSV